MGINLHKDIPADLTEEDPVKVIINDVQYAIEKNKEKSESLQKFDQFLQSIKDTNITVSLFLKQLREGYEAIFKEAIFPEKTPKPNPDAFTKPASSLLRYSLYAHTSSEKESHLSAFKTKLRNTVRRMEEMEHTPSPSKP